VSQVFCLGSCVFVKTVGQMGVTGVPPGVVCVCEDECECESNECKASWRLERRNQRGDEHDARDGTERVAILAPCVLHANSLEKRVSSAKNCQNRSQPRNML
jgi:hypothetical protein